MNTNIILWGASISPYVRKVMVALSEKELAYELRETLPKVLLQATGQPVPAGFRQCSPLGKIPALQVDDYMLSDSAVIAGYLDREFLSGNDLYPSNPEAYAKACWFEMYSDTVLTEVAYRKIFLEKVVKPNVLQQQPDMGVVERALSEELPPLLQFLDSSLQGRTWFAGESFSMADVAITTQLLALQMAEVHLDLKQWKYLNKLISQVISRDSFQEII